VAKAAAEALGVFVEELEVTFHVTHDADPDPVKALPLGR
jgi:hypothetical protein